MRQSGIPVIGIAALVGLFALSTADCGRGPSGAGLSTLSGDVVRYEPSGRTLILSTGPGESRFVVGFDVTIHEGATQLSSSALPSLVGRRAKIWYDDSGGRRTVHRLRVSRSGSRAR